jgi:hypothetical protein
MKNICVSLFVCLAYFVVPSSSFAYSVPWDVSPNAPQSIDIQYTRGEIKELHPHLVGLNISNATVVMLYKSADMTNYYAKAGSVLSATGGTAQVQITSADFTSNRVYSFEIFISSTNLAIKHPTGRILVTDSISDDGTTNAMPAAWSLIDWAHVVHQNLGSSPFPSSAGFMSVSTYDPAGGAKQISFADDARFADARTPLGHTQDWSTVSGKPTTYPPDAHTQNVSTITGVGSAATSSISQFASAAQGLTADAAGTLATNLSLAAQGAASANATNLSNNASNGAISVASADATAKANAAQGAASANSTNMVNAVVSGWGTNSAYLPARLFSAPSNDVSVTNKFWMCAATNNVNLWFSGGLNTALAYEVWFAWSGTNTLVITGSATVAAGAYVTNNGTTWIGALRAPGTNVWRVNTVNFP